MTDTITRITRAEANEKIAEWFEPASDLKKQGHLLVSLKGAWCRDWLKEDWRPRHDYTTSIDCAHFLLRKFRDCGFDKPKKLDGMQPLMTCEAFLYAVTGERYEITD